MGRLNTANKHCMQHLDIEEMIEMGCSYSECRQCGFNRNVWMYRKELLAKNGLTKCPDGLSRLILVKRSKKNGSKTA